MKTFNDFLISKSIISTILTKLESTIDNLVEEYNKININDNDKELNEHQKEMIRLYIIFDLVKSIEKYTLPDDKLIKLSSEFSNKGNLTISATIERDGLSYYLFTEVIIAGGYNIQKIHYRYITKTNLPQTNNKEFSNIINEKIKKLNKKEKIQHDIDELNIRIKNNNEKIEKNSKLNDDEIFDLLKVDDQLLTVKWEDIDDDSYAKQNNTKEEYLEKQQDYINRKINYWKYFNIESQINTNNLLQKQIDKLNIKLNQL